VSFQPFGYRFEIGSLLSPAEVKAKIRARKKAWFDMKSGARGWILGSYFCLWNSAFNQSGPMVFGRIVSDQFGTRLNGRAGSDLNGIIVLVLGFPLLGFVLYRMSLQDGSNGRSVITTLIFLGVISLIALWSAHAFRRDADILVRFLRDALEPKRKSSRTRPVRKFGGDIGLIVNGDRYSEPATIETLHDALSKLGSDDFLILERSADSFMQTLSLGDYFILEWRDGGDARFFRAYRNANEHEAEAQGDNLFTLDEALELLGAFGAGDPFPPFANWVPEKP
jgi:hypothetical protein